MTLMHDRLTFHDSEDLPEVTLGLIDDEPARRAFLQQFGERAVDAIQRFAERRERAGMGPQSLLAVHPDGKMRSHDYYDN